MLMQFSVSLCAVSSITSSDRIWSIIFSGRILSPIIGGSHKIAREHREALKSERLRLALGTTRLLDFSAGEKRLAKASREHPHRPNTDTIQFPNSRFRPEATNVLSARSLLRVPILGMAKRRYRNGLARNYFVYA
jgi:hypothetical protein